MSLPDAAQIALLVAAIWVAALIVLGGPFLFLVNRSERRQRAADVRLWHETGGREGRPNASWANLDWDQAEALHAAVARATNEVVDLKRPA